MAISEIVVIPTVTMASGSPSNTLVTQSTDTTGANAAIIHISHWGAMGADADYAWTDNKGSTFTAPLIKHAASDMNGLIFLAYGFTGGSGHQFTCTLQPSPSNTREFFKGGAIALSGTIGASSLEASCSTDHASVTVADAGTLVTTVATYMLQLQA